MSETILNNNRFLVDFRVQCVFSIAWFFETRLEIMKAVEGPNRTEECSVHAHELVAAYWLYFAGYEDELKIHRSRISDWFYTDVPCFLEEGLLVSDSSLRLSNARKPETTCPEFIVEYVLKVPISYRAYLHEKKLLVPLILDAYCKFIAEKIKDDEVLKSLSVLEEFLVSGEFLKASNAQLKLDRIKQIRKHIFNNVKTETNRKKIEKYYNYEPTGEGNSISPDKRSYFVPHLIGKTG